MDKLENKNFKSLLEIYYSDVDAFKDFLLFVQGGDIPNDATSIGESSMDIRGYLKDTFHNLSFEVIDAMCEKYNNNLGLIIKFLFSVKNNV
jgi:hypothetical protein